MNNVPEVIEEEKSKEDTIFLRTVLKKDVHERLRDFAKKYSTGRGNWDFGVAIEILLDNHDYSRQQVQSEKLDMILSIISNKESEEPEEDDSIELLGGSKIKRKE